LTDTPSASFTRAALADTTRRVEDLCRKRESALLFDDSAAIDALDAELAALEKSAGRQAERVRLLEQQAAAEETEAIAKRRQQLRDRFAKRLAEADAAADELQATMAHALTLFRKIVRIREDVRAAWPLGDAHTNASAGAFEGAALLGSAVRSLGTCRGKCDPVR
jgi:hypothetical protein